MKLEKIVSHVVSLVALSAALGGLGGCGGTDVPAKSPDAQTGHTRALDGTSYRVTLAYPGEAPMDDTLRFDGGRFESTACTDHGFPQWADYHADRDSDGIVFMADTRHPNGTTIAWKASVKDGVVDGTATRTMDGRVATATVRGEKH
jgi:hypothetical protein